MDCGQGAQHTGPAWMHLRYSIPRAYLPEDLAHCLSTLQPSLVKSRAIAHSPPASSLHLNSRSLPRRRADLGSLGDHDVAHRLPSPPSHFRVILSSRSRPRRSETSLNTRLRDRPCPRRDRGPAVSLDLPSSKTKAFHHELPPWPSNSGPTMTSLSTWVRSSPSTLTPPSSP